MKLEKINETKLKIIFDSHELEENNISVHSFLSNSLESQKLFLAILDIANEDLGFDTINSRISYEAISFDNKQFIIFITKLDSCLKNNNFSSFDITNFKTIPISFRDIAIPQNSNLVETTFFYFFHTLDELFDFCDYTNSLNIFFNFENSLYQYNDIFFIELNTKNLSIIQINNLFSFLAEFNTAYILSEFTKVKLKEVSTLLITNNAIQKL